MTRLIIIGLGPIGIGCIRAARADQGLDLIGLVDKAPHLVGKSAGELTACGKQQAPAEVQGPHVTDDLDAALAKKPDVAVICTTSSFQDIAPLLRKLAERGIHAVSSCEEMADPWFRHGALADEVDAAAKQGGAALLGTGVNPGYVMDTLAVSLASMVRKVKKVRCVRRVDASLRREPLQRKVGATMTVERFEQLKSEGAIGHKGLGESVSLVARGMGRRARPGEVTETLEPVVAEEATPSALGLIAPGQVRGMRNTATWENDGLRIELDLLMAVGEPDPVDKVCIEGPVSFKAKVPGGVPGDSATIAALMNQVPRLNAATPGLLTMLDLPPAGCTRK